MILWEDSKILFPQPWFFLKYTSTKAIIHSLNNQTDVNLSSDIPGIKEFYQKHKQCNALFINLIFSSQGFPK